MPSEKTQSSSIPSTRVRSGRRRIGEIGEVTMVGACWRLAYDQCDHVQEFAREGLEDPGRLARCIQRNFPTCLTCRLETAAPRKAVWPPLELGGLAPELMR